MCESSLRVSFVLQVYVAISLGLRNILIRPTVTMLMMWLFCAPNFSVFVFFLHHVSLCSEPNTFLELLCNKYNDQTEKSRNWRVESQVMIKNRIQTKSKPKEYSQNKAKVKNTEIIIMYFPENKRGCCCKILPRACSLLDRNSFRNAEHIECTTLLLLILK